MTAFAPALLFSVALLIAVPAALANHDSGQGKSQDHLHGKSDDSYGANSPLQVVQVPQPSSVWLLGLGAVAAGVAIAYRRRSA